MTDSEKAEIIENLEKVLEMDVCACSLCSVLVHKDEYTHPYCKLCYANPRCK